MAHGSPEGCWTALIRRFTTAGRAKPRPKPVDSPSRPPATDRGREENPPSVAGGDTQAPVLHQTRGGKRERPGSIGHARMKVLQVDEQERGEALEASGAVHQAWVPHSRLSIRCSTSEAAVATCRTGRSRSCTSCSCRGCPSTEAASPCSHPAVHSSRPGHCINGAQLRSRGGLLHVPGRRQRQGTQGKAYFGRRSGQVLGLGRPDPIQSEGHVDAHELGRPCHRQADSGGALGAPAISMLVPRCISSALSLPLDQSHF